MKPWRAVTESGAEYVSDGSSIRVNGEVFRNPLLKAIGISDVTWEKINASPPAYLPRLGKRIFVSTYGDSGWRLSTPVVEVEVLD